MKIACLTYRNSDTDLANGQQVHAVWQYVKSDSALLVNKKPFFAPPFSEDFRAGACAIARIKRMGKYVQRTFADRYFDGVTMGINFIAYDKWMVCQKNGLPWDTAVGFDSSMAVGEFVPYEGEWEARVVLKRGEEEQTLFLGQIMRDCLAEALEQTSQFITLRIGDLIAIDLSTEWTPIQRNDTLRAWINEEEKFECRIK